MRSFVLLALVAISTVSAKATSKLSQDLESELAKHQAALQSGPADDVSEAPAAEEPVKADDGAEALGPKSIKLQYHAPAQYPVHYPVAYPFVHPAFGAYGGFPYGYGHPAFGGYPYGHPAFGGFPFHPAFGLHPAVAAAAGVHPAFAAGAYPFAHPAFGAYPFAHPAFGAYPFGMAYGTATANGHPGFQAFTGGVHPAAFGGV